VAPQCVKNLSNIKLDPIDEDALRFGLNNPMLPKKICEDKLKTNIERLIYNVKGKTTLTIIEELKD